MADRYSLPEEPEVEMTDSNLKLQEVLKHFNRRVENNTLYIEKEDFHFGAKMMKKEIRTKYDVLRMEVFAESIRSMRELKRVVNSNEVSREQKNILQVLIKDKKLRN